MRLIRCDYPGCGWESECESAEDNAGAHVNHVGTLRGRRETHVCEKHRDLGCRFVAANEASVRMAPIRGANRKGRQGVMGTHVTFTADNGFKHTVEAVTVHDYGTSRKARFLDGVGAHGECDITPAEYTRLAALLVGEGGASRCSECPNAIGPGHAVCEACLKAAVDVLRAVATKVYECASCEDTGWVSAGSSPCRGCYERTRVNKAPAVDPAPPSADPRTPGQVAYEHFAKEIFPWFRRSTEPHPEWESLAAAVMAHGRGER